MLHKRRLGTPQARPVTSAILAAALVASAAAGVEATKILQTQGSSIDPVTPTMSTESLASGDSVVVDDPAIAAQGEGDGPRTVKQFTKDQEFSQFALTWTGQKDIAAYFRGQRADGSWTEWFNAEPLDYSSDASGAKNGTDLIYIEPTKTVQVSLSGVDLTSANNSASVQTPADGQGSQTPSADAAAPAAPAVPAAESTTATTAPAATGGTAPLPTNFGDIKPVAETDSTATSANDIEAVFMDGGESELPANGINLAADSDGMPRVISRAGWGADESMRCSNPEYDDHTAAIVIHHTAGSNNYTEAEAPGIVRGIYAYHAQTLGWCDIGYQSLADKYGNLYEGRYGGLNKSVHGAHAGGFNSNTWAISMLGNYDTVQPTAAMIKSVGELAGWRAKVGGFDPTGTDTHYSEGSSYTFYPSGTKVTLPNIFAHRDVGTTACPGQYAYAQMDTIRQYAKSKYNSILSGTSTSGGGLTTTTPKATATAAAPTTTQAQSTGGTTNTGNTGATSNTATNATTATELLDTLINSSSNGNTSNAASLGTAGSLAALALGLAASQGALGDVSTVGNVQVVNGLKLSQITPILSDVATVLGDPQMSATVNSVASTLGNVLGSPRSGVTTYASTNGETVKYALFDNGIVVDSPSTGAQALWGAIGDAWASQGFDLGPLGLPTTQEYSTGSLTRVDFQNGYITYDPATGKVDIQTK